MLERAEALREDFVPGDVGERHAEYSRLADALTPALRGDPAEHVLIFGPSGAGKTAVAKYALQQIENQHLGIHTHHIDCWEFHSRRKAIEALCRGCGKGGILHQQLAHDDLLDRIRRIDDPYIVVLDEIDQLDDLTLLRELYGMEDVAIVGIANRERDLLGRADEWLHTRLRTCRSLQFDAYTDDDLVSILQRRANVALDDDAITGRQLQTIARRSESNAGIAIGALRLAAERAQRQTADRITNAIIDDAIPAAEREERQRSLSRLTYEQRLLFETLPEDGSWLQSEEFHATYDEVSEEDKSRRTRRNWLQKMQHYNLVEKDGEGRGTRYRRLVGEVESKI